MARSSAAATGTAEPALVNKARPVYITDGARTPFLNATRRMRAGKSWGDRVAAFAPRLRPQQFGDAGQCAEAILERVGRRVVLALPLGLGKANHVANALFDRAVQDSRLELEILTGLTPEKPRDLPELQQRFVDPIVERLFGDYPDLAYVRALRLGALPANVSVLEFYLRPGAWLDVAQAQRAYVSLNIPSGPTSTRSSSGSRAL